jgi:hypothetical protein
MPPHVPVRAYPGVGPRVMTSIAVGCDSDTTGVSSQGAAVPRFTSAIP